MKGLRRVTWIVALSCAVLAATLAPAAALAPAATQAPAATLAPAADGPAPPYEQVARCVSDGRALEPLDAAVSPGQRLIQQTRLWELSRGAGVTVAVIDTGVRPSSALGDRLVSGADLVVPDSPKPGLDDCDGHGTLVAGLIAGAPDTRSGFAGVAPDARILAIRQNSQAFAPQGSTAGGVGTSRTLASAIDLAVAKGADVINISAAYCGPAVTANDPVLTTAVERAVRADVVVVVAAGNLGASDLCSTQNSAESAPVTGATPANIPAALTVGSVDADGLPADFSLAGPWVDLAAPGVRIISTNPHGAQDGQVGSLVGPDGEVGISGTSFSAPYVAGVAALVRSRFPHLNAEQVVRRLEATADHPAGQGERNIFVGFGIVDARRALTAVLPEEGAGPGIGPTRAAALPEPSDVGAATGGEVPALLASTALLAALGLILITRQMRRRTVPTSRPAET